MTEPPGRHPCGWPGCWFRTGSHAGKIQTLLRRAKHPGIVLADLVLRVVGVMIRGTRYSGYWAPSEEMRLELSPVEQAMGHGIQLD